MASSSSAVNILCMGDSLTYGYNGVFGSGKPHPYRIAMEKALVKEFPSTKFTVLNEGVNGNFTRQMVIRLRDCLENSPEGAQLDYVVILGGTNDIHQTEKDGSSTAASIKAMVDEIMARNANGKNKRKTKVLLCTIPETKFDYVEHVPGFVAAVTKQQRQLEETYKGDVVVCDVRANLPMNGLSEEERDVYWGDALHCTPKGYDRMGETIAKDLIAMMTKQ